MGKHIVFSDRCPTYTAMEQWYSDFNKFLNPGLVGALKMFFLESLKSFFAWVWDSSDLPGRPVIEAREVRKLPAKTRYGCNSYFKGNLVKVVCIYKECFAFSKHASGEICDVFV
ncbi:hypothetical protein COOONC_15678 [Cooperia oncophora]